MIPSVTTSTFAPKPAVAAAPPTASKTTAPPSPDTARASVGEAAAGNLRAETARAVDAPEQSAVAPRLRDQETAERTDRLPPDTDRPTGPPPAFEESPLERQARVALDPPDTPPEAAPPVQDTPGNATETTAREISLPGDDTKDTAPPPTPRERAEVSFAETRTMSEPREAAAFDVSR